jgi:hypothetical protein
MSVRALLSLTGIVILFGLFTYLVTVIEKKDKIVRLMDGLSEITFVQQHKLIEGKLWVQFDDTKTDWKSTARALAVYLSATIRGKIYLVVASKRQMILAPKDGSICHVVAEHGVVENDDCDVEQR